jgi:hypothetical protein
VAGYDDLSSRASAAGSMKRGGDPMGGGDMAPDDAPMDEEQGSTPDSQADIAMQAALDAIDQGAEVYGDQVAQEIRSHINAIRELVSQGEAGGEEDTPPADDSGTPSPDAGSTQGMESQTPATQATDAGGGFPQ